MLQQWTVPWHHHMQCIGLDDVQALDLWRMDYQYGGAEKRVSKSTLTSPLDLTINQLLQCWCSPLQGSYLSFLEMGFKSLKSVS